MVKFSSCKNNPSTPNDMSFFGGGGTGFGQTNQSSGFGTGSGFGSSNTGTGRSLSLAHWFFIRFCFDGLRVLPGTIRAALPLNTLLCFSGLRVGRNPQILWEGARVGRSATAMTRAKPTTSPPTLLVQMESPADSTLSETATKGCKDGLEVSVL